MKRLIRASTEIKNMDSEDILHNLKLLDDKLSENNMFGEIDIFGGAVMCLGLNARQSTHDIDAVFEPKQSIYQLIKQIAYEHDLPNDWMNDAVKGFVSPNGTYFRFGEDIFTNLTVCMTTPEYLFAMKCLSARIGVDSSTELSDIKFLINYLNIDSVETAEKIILSYYPESMFKPKTHYLLLELIAN